MTLTHPIDRGAKVGVTGAGIAVHAIGSVILVSVGISAHQGVRVDGMHLSQSKEVKVDYDLDTP